MGKKKTKTEIEISFLGNSAIDVTGSMILIETPTKNILLECGLVQGCNTLQELKENGKAFSFKASNIDYVFINHLHADHLSRLPKLISDGFNGNIIVSGITKHISKIMLKDSLKILEKDCDYFIRKKGMNIQPYFNEDDIERTIELMNVYDYGQVYELDENVSFKLLRNSHLIGAYQLELFIKMSSGHIKKILFTSDLGRTHLKNHYVDELEKSTKANIVISESTYGKVEKDNIDKRKKDHEKIKTVCEQVLKIDKGRILIPVFSLGRSHQILTDLYLMYKDDKDFNYQVVVDSPLIWEITKAMGEILDKDNLKLFQEVINWKNVRFIKDYNESKSCLSDKTPKIIISSSGFLNKGRIRLYLQEMINKPKDHILFVGYAPPNSIAGKIKSGQKSIFIEDNTYKIKIGITMLNSYSSHISHKELVNYLKSIQCDKIYLHHGEMDGRIELKEVLEEELSKQCKTTKVIVVNKGTKGYL